jgi:hypothetical protein
MTWTDDGGAETSYGICPYFNGYGSMDASVWSSVMLVKANTPLSYSVSGDTIGGSRPELMVRLAPGQDNQRHQNKASQTL